MEEYYKTLGVSKDASLEEIKSRYRFLAHAYHPDKFAQPEHKAQAEGEFKKISEAFKRLSQRKRSAFGVEEDASGYQEAPIEELDPKSSAHGKKASQPYRFRREWPTASHSGKATGRSFQMLPFLLQRWGWAGWVVLILSTAWIGFDASRKWFASTSRVTTSPKPLIETAEASLMSPSTPSIQVDLPAADPKYSDEGVMTDPEFIKASALLSQGKAEEALLKFMSLSVRFPRSPLVLVKVADAIGEKNADQSLILSNVQYVVDHPFSADAWLCLADVLNSREKVPEALYAYRKAVEIFPRFEMGWNALGLALDHQGKSDESIEAYRHALSINPRRPQNWNALALVLHKEGKVEEAIKVYQEAVQQQAVSANTWNNLGVSLIAQGREAEALEAFRNAVKMEPTLAKAWTNLGVGLQSAGKKEEAAQAFLQASKISRN